MEKSCPVISVIMGVYKEPEHWLCQSIDSILHQSFAEFEFIIIFDNPQCPEGLSLLKKYADIDHRIVLIINEENLGLTKSLNRGLSVAKGKYIARMDADDISMSKRFQLQYQYMETHPEVVVLGTNIKYIGRKAFLKRNDSIKFDDESIKAQMLLTNCMAHSTVFIRKSVLDETGITYDESFRQSQDYRLWELLRPYGKFAVLREKLLKYRISDQQITKSQTKGQANLADSVRYRLQKNWLIENGVNYTDEELKSYPFRIIERLRLNSSFNDTLEYKAFLQYAYLLSGDSSWTMLSLLKYDIRKMPVLNIMRLLVRSNK